MVFNIRDQNIRRLNQEKQSNVTYFDLGSFLSRINFTSHMEMCNNTNRIMDILNYEHLIYRSSREVALGDEVDKMTLLLRL